MNAISGNLAHQYPTDDAGWGAVVVPLHDSLVESMRSALLILLGAVVLVLLIACTHITNLTVAKALGRRKEIAIRTALGASRGRVMRQVLTETVLVSVTGGVLALLPAHFIGDAIAAFTWKSTRANLSRMLAPPVAASRRWYPSSACWIHRPRAAMRSTANWLLDFLFPNAAASETGKSVSCFRHSI
jgi:ABC-type antimicrobial peptide transport system permease subunit